MDLICFDLDNTLINSDKAHVKVYNDALEKLGLKRVAFNKVVKHFGRPKLGVAKMIAPKNNLKDWEFIRRYHRKYLDRELPKSSKKIKGVNKTIKLVKEKYKIGILSNNDHRNIIKSLKAVRINWRQFDVIIGNNDVKHDKPNPDEIFKAERLTKSNAKFMIGDSIYDIMAAKRSKTKSIGVLTGHYSRYVLKKYKPDYVITSIVDVPRILKIK